MNSTVKLLKALGDETRLRILQCLRSGEHCACSIVPAVGKAQPTVSRHLRILEEAGVLTARREGVNIWYSIRSREALDILNILGVEHITVEDRC